MLRLCCIAAVPVNALHQSLACANHAGYDSDSLALFLKAACNGAHAYDHHMSTLLTGSRAHIFHKLCLTCMDFSQLWTVSKIADCTSLLCTLS